MAIYQQLRMAMRPLMRLFEAECKQVKVILELLVLPSSQDA